MKFKHILIPLIMLSVIFSSCEDDMPGLNPQPTSPVLEGYYFRLLGIGGDAVASRTNYPNSVQSYFDPGDRVGIFTIDASGTAVQSNLLYTVVGNAGEAQALEDTGTKALEGDGYKYLIYYPYSKTMTLSGLADLTHSVSAGQNMSDEDDEGLTEFEKSDFLWDLTTVAVDADSNEPLTGSDGNKYVNVVMDHVTATIIINVMSTFGEGSVVPKLLNMQRTVTSGIDLTAAPTVDALRTAVFNEDYTASKLTYNSAHRGEIAMQQIKYSASDKVTDDGRTFRAAVPPQIIESGQTIVTVGATEFKYTHPDGKPLALKPGKRYTFHVNDPTKPFIDIDDDDSWIFDVIDPVTGEKVGLLCREYIRYQPNRMDSRDNNITLIDQPTGVPVDVEANGTTYHTKTISSQVWVYYDLWKFVKNNSHDLEQYFMTEARNQDAYKEDDDPYLDSGTALRFIYDLRFFVNKTELSETEENRAAAGYPEEDRIDVNNVRKYWPYPHQDMWSNGGIFLSKHGQMWAKSPSGNYGESTGNQIEFNMHGGKIYWGCYMWPESGFKFNGVKLFVMPKDAVDTPTAVQYGHINIIRDTKTGEPIGTEVSYKPYLPSDRNVGVLVPKYINDSRNADEGVITYPLVKIGYNNIWSKQGLRTRYYNNGKPIQCYQRANGKFDFPKKSVKFTDSSNPYNVHDIVFDMEMGSINGYWSDGFFTEKSMREFDNPGCYAYPFNDYFNTYDYLSTFAPEEEGLKNAARRAEEMKFTKLYNFSAIVYDKDILVPGPGSYDSRMSCYIPRVVRFYELYNYVGAMPGVKLMTSHITARINGKEYSKEQLAEALKKQEFVTNGLGHKMDSYTSNAAGMDFRPLGILLPQQDSSGFMKVKAGGFSGGGTFGTLVGFWMDGDATHTPLSNLDYFKRSDRVCFVHLQIWDAWDGASYSNIIGRNFRYPEYSDITKGTIDGIGFTEHSLHERSFCRSRIHCGVRPVLKFNHQNGPNPHEKTNAAASVARGVANMVKGAAKSKAPSVQAVSRVSSSGDDVSVTLTPISIYNR